MGAEAKYRDIVRDIALDHYGYVTTRGAANAGVPPVELPKLRNIVVAKKSEPVGQSVDRPNADH